MPAIKVGYRLGRGPVSGYCSYAILYPGNLARGIRNHVRRYAWRLIALRLHQATRSLFSDIQVHQLLNLLIVGERLFAHNGIDLLVLVPVLCFPFELLLQPFYRIGVIG